MSATILNEAQWIENEGDAAQANQLSRSTQDFSRRSGYLDLFKSRERWSGRGFAHDQLRLHGEDLGIVAATDSFHQDLGGEFAHSAQWLTNRGESRVLESSVLDVIEADDRHVAGYPDARIKQRAN